MTYGTHMRRMLLAVCLAGALRSHSGTSVDPSGGACAPAADRASDSLYRAGREALARRDYHGAADLFALIVARYPAAEVAADAQYWRGYSLYVSGNLTHSLRDLRGAQDALDAEEQSYPGASAAREGLDLRARVVAAEATLGDAIAKNALDAAVASLAQPVSCNDKDLALKLVALERLIDRDPESAMPTIRRVLSTQGPCAEEVRRATTVVVASTPGMNATKMVDDLARADRSLTLVQAVIPPIRPLGPILRISIDSLGAIGEIRVLSDGRVLVNDTQRDRLVLFDSSLAHFIPVMYAAGDAAKSYGAESGSLFPFTGDSSLYADFASLSFLVIDPAGRIVRVMAAPMMPGYPGGLIYLVAASIDPQGNVVSKWGRAEATHMGLLASGRTDGVSPRPTLPPGDPSAPPVVVLDSDVILRVSIETRRIDTAVWLSDAPRATVGFAWTATRLPGTTRSRCRMRGQ